VALALARSSASAWRALGLVAEDILASELLAHCVADQLGGLLVLAGERDDGAGSRPLAAATARQPAGPNPLAPREQLRYCGLTPAFQQQAENRRDPSLLVLRRSG
jgi:hypothetical protein